MPPAASSPPRSRGRRRRNVLPGSDGFQRPPPTTGCAWPGSGGCNRPPGRGRKSRRAACQTRSPGIPVRPAPSSSRPRGPTMRPSHGPTTTGFPPLARPPAHRSRQGPYRPFARFRVVPPRRFWVSRSMAAPRKPSDGSSTTISSAITRRLRRDHRCPALARGSSVVCLISSITKLAETSPIGTRAIRV